jgi:glycine hydroxymethyltransferase
MGTPAVTTRGMREPEMDRIAGWVAEVLDHLGDAATESKVRAEVEVFTQDFPLYSRRWKDSGSPPPSSASSGAPSAGS